MADSYRIPPLNWEDLHNGLHVASTKAGDYCVRRRSDSDWCWRKPDDLYTQCESLEAGKALAQADWIARVVAFGGLEAC